MSGKQKCYGVNNTHGGQMRPPLRDHTGHKMEELLAEKLMKPKIRPVRGDLICLGYTAD